MDDDARLAERCLAGDPQAWSSFVHRFEGAVFGICLRMLQHRQDAEDVAQETLVRAVKHLGRWDAARRLAPWVMSIAVNRCRTRLSQRRSITHLGEVDQVQEETPRAANSGLAEELELAIAALREDYRASFVLFYQQELGVEEVAEVMGCPTGTIKTWLYRARKEIARKLVDRGVVSEAGDELYGI